VVEGFARFIEDQLVEMGRRGLRFDDAPVPSLDATAQLEPAGVLLPIERLVDLDHVGFGRLGDEPLARVQLRNTIVRLELSERAIFYEGG